LESDRCSRCDQESRSRQQQKWSEVMPPAQDKSIRRSGLMIFLFAITVLSGCKQRLTNDELRGQALYKTNCSECHEQSQPGLWKAPPKLSGVFQQAKLPDGVPASDQAVHQVIVQGLHTMPAFDGRLKDAEIDQIIAYLHTTR